MSDLLPTNTPQPTVLAEILLVPSENEEDDFETLSIVEDVTAGVMSSGKSMQKYTLQLASGNRRNAGVILLLGEIVHQAISQKDLIIAFLQAGTAAIDALVKQRHVSKIEMSLDGDTISIENPDTTTVKTLLDLYEAKHPGITTKVKSSSTVKVIGKVSKKEHRSSK